MLSHSDPWTQFVLEVELARNYPAVFSPDGGPQPHHPLLDALLSSLLFVKLASLVDDALNTVILRDGLSTPKANKKPWLDLNTRIEILEHHGRLKPEHVKHLHQIRKWRNQTAHKADPALTDWRFLDEGLRVAEAALMHLGVAGPRPRCEFFVERSKAEDSTDPGVLFVQRYKAGIRVDGKDELTHHWTVRTATDTPEAGA